MAVPNKQIGWSNESNLLWQIAKQVEYLTKITANTNVTVINTDTNPVPVIGPLTNEEVLNTSANFGVTPFRLIAGPSDNATIVKDKEGSLHSLLVIGIQETITYLKIYDKSTLPTNSDTPVMTIPIPTNLQGAGVALSFSTGINFVNGIGIRITLGLEDNDNLSVEAGSSVVNLTYA
jgi:hypothetical protein